MTENQIEKLAQMGADVACFRDFVPEITQRVKTLEQERQETRGALEELRQKVANQAAQIEALQKPD
jgi:uncharacterized coiled-coil DUF342 family protein